MWKQYRFSQLADSERLPKLCQMLSDRHIGHGTLFARRGNVTIIQSTSTVRYIIQATEEVDNGRGPGKKVMIWYSSTFRRTLHFSSAGLFPAHVSHHLHSDEHPFTVKKNRTAMTILYNCLYGAARKRDSPRYTYLLRHNVIQVTIMPSYTEMHAGRNHSIFLCGISTRIQYQCIYQRN